MSHWSLACQHPCTDRTERKYADFSLPQTALHKDNAGCCIEGSSPLRCHATTVKPDFPYRQSCIKHETTACTVGPALFVACTRPEHSIVYLVQDTCGPTQLEQDVHRGRTPPQYSTAVTDITKAVHSPAVKLDWPTARPSSENIRHCRTPLFFFSRSPFLPYYPGIFFPNRK